MTNTAPEPAIAKIRQLGVWRLTDTVFCLAVAAILYSRFFWFPTTPIVPAAGDQSIFLWGASRMVEGQVIYRDFFQFITPGTEVLYFVLIKTFGQTASLPRLITLGVAVAYTVIGLRISRRVLSDWRVYLGPLLFLAAGFLPFPDPTHHVFSTLAVLCALDLQLLEIDAGENRPKLQFLSGALCGLSCFFTPSRGVIALVAMGLVTLSDRFNIPNASAIRRISNLVIGFLAAVIVLLGPTIWLSGFQNVLNDVVLFTLKHYRGMPYNDLRCYGTDLPIAGIGMPTLNTPMEPAAVVGIVKWSLIYFISPGIYLLFAAGLWRKRAAGFGLQEKKLLLIAVIGSALFLSVAYAPTHFRMGVVSMPATILTAWFLRSDRTISRILALGLASFAVAVVRPAGIWQSQRNTLEILRTPTGAVAVSDTVFDSTAEKYAWLNSHTQPGDYLFSQYAEHYYLFRLRNPGPVPFLTNYDYTTEEQVQETLAGIRRHKVKYIIWPKELQASTRSADEVPPEQFHLQPLCELMHNEYRLVHVFGDSDEVWQRK
jgi:hypothetical protein